MQYCAGDVVVLNAICVSSGRYASALRPPQPHLQSEPPCLNERGEGFIPWHHDEIRAHGEVKLIATVSLGSERTFQLRRRVRQEDGGPATGTGDGDDQLLVGGGGGGVESVCAARDSGISVRLKPGSLLVMAGEVQSHWLHSLPLPEPRDDSNHRISLTFRSIVPGYEEDLARRTHNCVGSTDRPSIDSHKLEQ